MKRLIRLLATSLYTGYSPIAPGTTGSLLALFIFWICPEFRGTLLAVAIAVTYAVGVWVATEVEKTDGHDASIINIDEVAGMWLSLLFLPVSAGFFWHIGGFFLFRIFDISS